MDRATGCRRPEPVVGCWPCRPPHRMSPWTSCALQEVRWWLRVCVSRCKRSRSVTVMKVETACSVSQFQLIVAGYTIRALLLRLHSPHKSPPCKGEPQLINYHILIRQASLASSASTRHFRLRIPCRPAAALAATPGFRASNRFSARPCFPGSLLPAGLYVLQQQEEEGEERVLPGRNHTPAAIPMTVWIEQAPDPRLPSTNRRWTTPTTPRSLLLLGQPGRRAGRGGLGCHLCSPASSPDSRRWQRGYAVPTSSPPSNVPPRCMLVAGFASYAGRVDPATRGSYQHFLFEPVIRVWDWRYG